MLSTLRSTCRSVNRRRLQFAYLILAAGLAAGVNGVAVAQTQTFDWRTELTWVTRFLETPGRLHSSNCTSSIDAFADRLERLPSDAFTPKTSADVAAAESEAPRALEGFFRLRLLLKQRLDSFASPSKACLNAMRRGLRVARFAEDYLADWLRARGKDNAQNPRLFGGGPAQVSINPAFGSVDIRTGDLLLMRGPSFVSALIARSGDEAGDFSHLAIVGEDSSGRKHVVEALIEKGVTTAPLEDYLDNKPEGRVVLLRYKDAATARAAGQLIYARAKAGLDAGAPIKYNFRLDRRDNSRLFCAQVIEYAYQLATRGRVDLPKYPSTLVNLKKTPIYDALGIRAIETFAPSDIQLDPRFQIVAEYRNTQHLRAMRYGNVVLTKLLEWMRAGYSVKADSFGDFVAGVILRFISGGNISEDAGLPNRESVGLLVSIGRVASALVNAVETIDADAESQKGHALTFRELAGGIEDIRLRECRQAGERPIVQRLLAAPGSTCRVATR